MGEEIFGDKSPHQVSVSEGSGNAGSSRNRSGKFKADTSRRISVDADEGEMVSRHISSDGETHVTGGPGRNNPDPLAAQPENGHPGGAQQNTGDDRTGPMLGREGLSDRSLSVSEGSAEENRQALPGNEAQDTQRLRIPATDAADNQQLLPDTDAAAPNLARLPAQGDVSNRIALPDMADSDAGQGPIIQADGSRHSPSVTGTGSAPASGPAIEPSNYPHAAPLAKSDPTDHHEGLVSVGHSDNKVPVQGAGLADRHVPVPGEDGHADNRQAVDSQALQDRHEPAPGQARASNVQHLPTGDGVLAHADIGHAQPNDGHENDENIDENEAFAPTHMDDGAELAMAEVGEESHPAPQAIKLQADLWREGFRGRVAQIREQVALIHENLDKLEK